MGKILKTKNKCLELYLSPFSDSFPLNMFTNITVKPFLKVDLHQQDHQPVNKDLHHQDLHQQDHQPVNKDLHHQDLQPVKCHKDLHQLKLYLKLKPKEQEDQTLWLSKNQSKKLRELDLNLLNKNPSQKQAKKQEDEKFNCLLLLPIISNRCIKISIKFIRSNLNKN